MIQLGQAARPDELRLMMERGMVLWELHRESAGMDDFERAAMDRHYELLSLPGVCEALARRDWDAIDRIAERWDYT